MAEPYRSILKALLEALRKRFGDKLISLVVYGSVARGEFRRDSDLDILVIIEGLP
ncbi:MAG TPA: nucleotidyltransferase domain-containing protein, partial [Archaeoglobus sp.]|nr:nucleotidyltransferase domain-containing protein [Archaeoglobus sp.]